MLRYLVGPVTRTFAEQNLQRFRQEGVCLAFNSDGDVDLTIKPGDRWPEVQGRFPAEWRPDYLVLNLPYATIPECLWTAPLPRVALGSDWNLLWHYYRHALASCDLIVTDTPGADVMKREGLGAVWAANLCGSERLFVEKGLESSPASPDQEYHSPPTTHHSPAQDIDILFLGNINPAVQKERMPWLARVARLSRKHRVLMQTGIFGETGLRLLQRARIVFQFSARGKYGRRSGEAAAAGALVFQEADNRELFHILTPDRECVAYHPDDLDTLLEHYLAHEDERRQLAEAARVKAPQLTFEHLWGELAGRIEENWAALRDRAGRLFPLEGMEALQLRGWQTLCSTRWDDPTLIRDLERAAKDRLASPWIHNAMGVLLARQAQTTYDAQPLWEVAANCFRAAARPDFILAAVNLAQALDAGKEKPLALETARQALARLLKTPELDALSREGLPLCHGFDPLRVEWDRAAYANAGHPEEEARTKRRLLLWQLHSLLARWTGEPGPAYEASLLRPDLPTTRVVLGEILLRTGQAAQAAEHLRQALEANPLDREAAHLCYLALDTENDRDGQRRLCEERRLLARAAPNLVPTDPWFAERQPRGHELVSIIVLCARRLEDTRRCLDSLPRCTRAPYELILVENGVTDGTREYLQELRRKNRVPRASSLGWGPERIEIIANDRDRGFAAAANQGVAEARGLYVVLLGGDTVVTPGWLEGLVKWSLAQWPDVGLVGPVTNAAPEPQGLRDGPASLEGLNAFAAQRRRAFAGSAVPVNRLIGSCVLARHEVLERIGGLDERFPVGFFSDDDWCLRAREAGFRLLVAQEVFVYQSGQGPFAVTGEEARQQLRENFGIFRAKWGPEVTAAYSLPAQLEAEKGSQGDEKTAAEPPVVSPSPPLPLSPAAELNGDSADRPRVSLCMIVKNEEHHLGDCLRSVADLVDEMVVVDTGSEDRTRELAREFGARVFDFPWPDSFGRARNESVSHARGKWILWLDADDRLDEENRQHLKQVLAGLGDERDAYAMKVRSALDANRNGFRVLDQVRMFRNLPEIRWDYRIHEQILPAVNRAGGGVRWTPVVIDHVGYVDPAMRQKKLDRNLRLLEMDAGERSDDSFSLFNLGWTLLDMGRSAEALPHLQRSLETAASHSSILRKLYHLLGVCQRNLGKPEEALKICQKGLGLFPDDAEMLLEEGMMLRDKGDMAGAEQSWLKLFIPRQGNYFASEEVGLRGFKTRQLLTEIYARQERWLEAEVQCRAALAERPDFEPAWMGLAEICLRQGRHNDLEELLERVEPTGAPPAKLGWLRARSLAQRQEFARARQALDRTISLDPKAIGPRVLLSHVLLQEGKDWPAAERALRDILDLEPTNQEAQHNLQLLLRNRARAQQPLAAGAMN
jgi:glycosyltransferase involved in cell wall biosynthesis/Tfp pilus assembly protein PilF